MPQSQPTQTTRSQYDRATLLRELLSQLSWPADLSAESLLDRIETRDF